MSRPFALRHRSTRALRVAVLCLVLLPLPALALPTFDDVRGQWQSSDWVLLARVRCSGVDWRGAAAAAWANLWNTRMPGAGCTAFAIWRAKCGASCGEFSLRPSNEGSSAAMGGRAKAICTKASRFVQFPAALVAFAPFMSRRIRHARVATFT